VKPCIFLECVGSLCTFHIPAFNKTSDAILSFHRKYTLQIYTIVYLKGSEDCVPLAKLQILKSVRFVNGELGMMQQKAGFPTLLRSPEIIWTI
jgi:hypothetical protein